MQEGEEDKEQEENDANNDDSHFNDEHFADVGLAADQDQANGDADSQDNGDSDSDDSDDVKVTIGEIKSGPQAYASLNIKVSILQYGSTVNVVHSSQFLCNLCSNFLKLKCIFYYADIETCDK